MTVSDKIQLAYTIVTVLIFIVGFINFIELKNNNKNLIKPDIYVSEQRFGVYTKWSHRSIPDCNFIQGDDRYILKEFGNLKGSIDLSSIFIVRNIGMGQAKIIKYKFKYDVKQLLKIIKRIDEKNQTLVQTTRNYVKFFWNNVLYRTIFKKAVNNFQSFNISILPYTQNQKEYGLKLPSDYFLMNSYLIFVALQNEKTIGEAELPDLKLFLEFHDSFNNKYRKNIILRFKLNRTDKKYNMKNKKLTRFFNADMTVV